MKILRESKNREISQKDEKIEELRENLSKMEQLKN